MRKLMRTPIVVGIIIVLIAMLGFLKYGLHSSQSSVNVWITTADQNKLLHQEAGLVWAKDNIPNDSTIVIDGEKEYQQIDGFGAAMTDSSAWLIANKLNPEQRSELMNKLFDHKQGIGISYLRLPMGATDFSLKSYTYDDMPEGQTDPKLQNFSIDYDKAYIIPTLSKAKELNPDLKIMGSPWSAPAWMKTSGSLIKGSLNPDFYQAYADYFTKFVQAYKAEGLSIDAITPQNEPHFEPDGYPGMKMEPADQAIFIKSHLGPAFEQAKLGTKIVIWDHNWDEPYYPIQILTDPEASKYIAGSAFHGYAGEVSSQQKVHDLFPNKDIYFTESSGGEWSPDFAASLKWDMQNLIIGSTRYWAKTVLKWNLALDESFGPKNGGCPNCRGFVKIDQKTGEISYNPEYYAFGHASKFVRAGAYRIDSNTLGSGNIEDVAFRNPNGSEVLIAFNSAAESRSFKVQRGSKSFSYTLPAGAAATFLWEGEKRTAK
jgi:glucosylceramidase